MKYPLIATAFIALSLAACGETEGVGDAHGELPATGIQFLEDNYHSVRQDSRTRASYDRRNYDASHGYSKSIELLELRGVDHRYTTRGPLTRDLLDGYEVLFINLVDDKRPGFGADEVGDIVAYVEDGGSLLMIVDHTNAYGSSDVAAALLNEFDLDVAWSTVAEAQEFTFKDPHWLNLTRFEPHPVLQDIQNLGFFAAGPILGPGSIGRTSDEAFRDKWDPEKPPSFWGNFRQDEDEETTSSSVVNAVEYGEGRVLVVADQNIFGNLFMSMADNRTLWQNAVQWLAQDDSAPWRDQPYEKPEVFIDYRWNDSTRYSASGQSGAAIELSRQESLQMTTLLTSPARQPEALILFEPAVALDDEDPLHPAKYLETGKDLIIYFDPVDPSETSEALLAELWPEFEYELLEDSVGGPIVGFDTGREFTIDDAPIIELGDTGAEVIASIEDTGVPYMVRKGRLHLVLHPRHAYSHWQASEAVVEYLKARLQAKDVE